MGWVFVILLIIILIILLWGLAGAIIQVGIASLPAWGIGLLVGLVVFYGLRQRILVSLRTPQKLAKLVNLSFDGRRLHCSIDHTEVEKYADSTEPISISVLVCVAVTVGVLVYLANSTEVFLGHKFLDERMSETTSIVLGVIISAIVISYTFAKVKPTESFRQQIKAEVERLVATANFSLKVTDDLHSLIQQNASFASKLKISLPEPHTQRIRTYVEQNKSFLLIDTNGVSRIINAEISKAKDDYVNLERSTKILDDVMQSYFQTAYAVNKTGSPTLIVLLDEILKQLEGSKQWLQSKEWSKFPSVVKSIKEDLELLYNSSINYQEPTSPPIDEVPTDDPYGILGVNPQMTDEEIKKVYLALIKIYHEGTGMVKDENKWKEINSAYQRISEKRKPQNG